jgi:two-component system, NtrC family, C4-dicarboxylate transport response regulator DctD
MTAPGSLPAIILVDDDDDARVAAEQLLRLADFEVRAFADPRVALKELQEDFPGILITDVRMPHMSGIELFSAVRARDAELPTILITGHGDVAMAVDAIKAGAWDFLTKPYDSDALIAAATRAAATRALVIENRRLHREAAGEAGDDAAGAILGESAAIRQLRAIMPVLAQADLDLVIEGESGTGKALLARTLHRMGRRGRHRLATIDCATVPPAMLQREVFGRGGLVARAHRGTLLLTGLDRASDALQDQLTQLIETRSVALDTRDPDPVDIRIIATAIPDGRARIRPTLYHRLAGSTLRVPPLAERREDISLLFATFVRRLSDEAGQPAPPLAPWLPVLASRGWSGNVRELAHFAQRVCLGLERPHAPASDEEAGLTAQLDAFERAIIMEAVTQAGGDVSRAVKTLRIPRKTFYYRANRLGIDLAGLREKSRGSPASR